MGARPMAQSTLISSSLRRNGALIASWMRLAAFSASSMPRRRAKINTNSLPPARQRAEPERSAHGVLDATCGFQRIFHAAAESDDHPKLVTARSSQPVAGSQGGDEAAGGGGEQAGPRAAG